MESAINEMLVCDPQRSRSITHVFISRPTPIEERALGRLLIVSEISSRDRVNVDIIKTIQEILKERYYLSERETVEAALEETLTTANQRVAELVGDFGPGWFERCHFVIASVRGNEIHFATIGAPHVLLIHRGRIVDLLANLAPRSLQINLLKAFTHTYSGRLEEDDHFLCLTTAFFDYISQEKLKRLFLDAPPESAMRALERLLTEYEHDGAFAAGAVSPIKERPRLEQPAPTIQTNTSYGRVGLQTMPTAPQASMEALMSREASTNEILKQSLWRSFQRTARSAIQKLRMLFRSVVLQKPTRISPALERLRVESDREERREPRSSRMSREARSTIIKRERLQNLPNSIKKISRRFLLGIIHGFHLVGSAVTRRPTDLRRDLQGITEQPRSIINRLTIRFKRLAPSRKFLLIVILLIALAFSGGLTIRSRTRIAEQSAATIQTTKATIEEKISTARANLLYGDESGARKVLADASALVAALPTGSKAEREERVRLEGLIAQEREKVQHRIILESPETVIDLAPSLDGGTVSGLVANGSSILAINPTGNTVITVDLRSKSAKASSRSTLEGNYQYAIPTANSLLILNTTNRVEEYNLTSNTIRERAIRLSGDANIGAIAYYQSRLYILDVKNGQIWRHTRSGNDFSSAAAWLPAADASLSTAVSLAIDGSIYVLRSDGTLSKYTRGTAENFGLDPVDPVLSAGSKVVTTADHERIYILDPNGKRVLAFTKDGSLVNQYTSPAFTDIRDLAVGVDEKTAFVLNGTVVLAIPLAEAKE